MIGIEGIMLFYACSIIVCFAIAFAIIVMGEIRRLNRIQKLLSEAQEYTGEIEKTYDDVNKLYTDLDEYVNSPNREVDTALSELCGRKLKGERGNELSNL